jgi:hypothetical protein
MKFRGLFIGQNIAVGDASNGYIAVGDTPNGHIAVGDGFVRW